MDAQHLLGTLKKLAQAIAQSFDVDALLAAVLDACLDVSQACAGVLYLSEGPGSLLTPRAHRGFAIAAMQVIRSELEQAGEECACSRLRVLFEQGQPIVLDPESDAARPCDRAFPAHATRGEPCESCRRWVGVPIRNEEGRAVGAITLHALGGDQPLQEGWNELLDLLLTLGDLAYAAIEKINEHHNRLYGAVRDLVDDFGKAGDPDVKISNVLHAFDHIACADGSSIWLIEGSRLRCRYATGHYQKVRDEDPDGYDLTLDPSEAKVGLTAWIAKTGEFVHFKTREQEKSHPQWLGKFDTLLYDQPEEKRSFLGAPLRIEDRIVGVIKSNKIDKPGHTTHFFTDLDAQQFRFLSLIAAGAVKIARDMPRAQRAAEMLLKLYEIGTRCNEKNKVDEILWYFLVGLTNADGIGLNRAAWLEVRDVGEQLELLGRMAIGPVGEQQGQDLQRHFQKHFDATGQDTESWLDSENLLRQFRDNDYQVPKPSGELQTYIEGHSVKIEKDSPLHRRIANLDQPMAEPLSLDQIGEKAKTIFSTLDFKEGVIFGLPSVAGRRLLGFCDYVYTPGAERLEVPELVRLIGVFLKQIHLAIERVALRQDQERVREKTWREFRAATAHRIGTEVADISGALRKLRFLAEGEDEEAQGAYSRIHSSLDRMRGVIAEYGRLAIDRPLRLRSVDLARLVRRAERDATFPERGPVRVELQIETAPPRTFADEEMLHYVFMELLHNAFKAIDDKENGLVVIRVTYDQTLHCAYVRFDDNGSGIPPEARERIFDSGFYLREGGSGQGLYIVRSYVRRHNGTVELEEATKGRVVFRLCIPIREEPHPGAIRVLVVDDRENLARDVCDAIVERWPTFEIRIAMNKDQALALVANGTEWDLAVLDLVLGEDSDRSGVDILRALRQRGLATKAIMVTSHQGLTVPSDAGGESVAADVCRALGAQAFVYRNRPGVDYIEEVLDQIAETITVQ